MPLLRLKVKTFHDFAISTLSELFTQDALDKSLRLEVNTLETGVLINLGKSNDRHAAPQFRFQPFPAVAQISPSFGVAITDFDADGWPDCVLAQNFFAPQREWGRMDSGLSLLLRGRGQGAEDAIRFEPVWPKQSGIVIPHDAKAVSVVDFNEDRWPDVLVTVNDGTIEALECQPHEQNQLLRVKLIGAPGNPDCVGAAVTVRFEDNTVLPQMAEVFAGGGYLSQSCSTLTFGCGKNSLPKNIEVRWPNGETTIHPVKQGQLDVVIRQP